MFKNGTEYLRSSKGLIITMTITSVDYELIKQQYNIQYIEFIDGYLFQADTGFFKQYIDKYMKEKIENEGAKRAIPKLFLNNLYGKFGSNPKSIKKTPYLDSEGIVKYSNDELEYRKPNYVHMACFITDWARHKT